MTIRPRCSLCRLAPYTAAAAAVEALVEDRPAFRLSDGTPDRLPRVSERRPVC
jgi:hypothetical protein